MEPASLMMRTPSGVGKEVLGTGGNLGTSIVKGRITQEVAPGTAGTLTGTIPESITLGTRGWGLGGGVGQGTSAEIGLALVRTISTQDSAMPIADRDRTLNRP